MAVINNPLKSKDGFLVGKVYRNYAVGSDGRTVVLVSRCISVKDGIARFEQHVEEE